MILETKSNTISVRVFIATMISYRANTKQESVYIYFKLIGINVDAMVWEEQWGCAAIHINLPLAIYLSHTYSYASPIPNYVQRGTRTENREPRTDN
jgi:hypothetical protein